MLQSLNPQLTQDMSLGNGIRADDPRLNSLPVREPELSQTGKAWLTVNGFGFETAKFTSDNWLRRELNDFFAPGQKVLDIGSGFGAISTAAIAAGATVISNDLAHEHLLYTRKQVSELDRSRLFLSTAKFPDQELEEGSLNVIIAHRMLHFLSGSEIEAGITKCHSWLRPGGMLAIVALSAEHSSYREQFYPEFVQKKAAGIAWPGEGLDVKKHMPTQAYSLPVFMHVFEFNHLAEKIEAAGFSILSKGYVSHAQFGLATDGRDGREQVGVIAQKPE